MRWLARLLLVRFLPRRLLPLLTAWEVYRLVRGQRRARTGQPDKPIPGAARRRPPPR